MNPRTEGYRMPAEWAHHQRTFVSWPVKASMCFPETHERVCAGMAEFIAAIAEFEPVTVLVNPEDENQARSVVNPLLNLSAQGGITPHHPVEWFVQPHNDSWLRDNGPTFVVDDKGGLAGINWIFNAWGGKYAPWDLDNEVAPAILDRYGIRRFDAPLVMEGGSLHTDGEGTLLTTEECLLNPNRNPQMDRQVIVAQLMDHLAVDKVIWLEKGLDGDETDGHVDNIACFAAPGKVILQVCRDEEDPNFRITQDALTVLRSATDARGRKLEVIEIPQPPMRMGTDGRLTLSYLNFYFVNGGIILPLFGDEAEETDRDAVRILADAFPDRRIRTINGMGIVTEGGNVHCATQQMPG